ncbi:hypothetical protein J8J14_18210 [Roseomonas sp. SSH11]|uniref:Head-to-tail connector protein n=1 Tax=Pararoseomonas baculiformis TaxID=2820812 RepID=A0ABS4AI73_9PROT|nr:hypothetical protein [Pararoseomonas baculiformis]MBP0446714.1 hypothetical protein [Pararoseomonas baculiformis]
MTSRTITHKGTSMASAAIRTTSLPPLPDEAVRQAHALGVQRQKEKEAREAAAAGPGSVTLIATTSFTIVGNPDEPEGRVVNAGDEFTVSRADLPRYAGRGMPKAEA